MFPLSLHYILLCICVALLGDKITVLHIAFYYIIFMDLHLRHPIEVGLNEANKVNSLQQDEDEWSAYPYLLDRIRSHAEKENFTMLLPSFECRYSFLFGVYSPFLIADSL
jgi:hypothetical protein